MTTGFWEIFEAAMIALAPRGRVALAVSGGADSMALLHLACAWNKTAASPVDLVAVTVDHGLRAESAEEAIQVKAWVDDLGISHITLVWNDDKPSGNVEAEARAARYRLLGAWCLENHVTNLMTAHHFDDQAETFLMRLARGSGVSGLASMPRERALGPGPLNQVRLLRPLLDIRSQDLKEMLQEVRQPWLEDPTNENTDFMRARARGLRETFESLDLGADRIVATAERMADAQVVLEDAVDRAWGEIAEVSRFGEVKLNLAGLMGLAADTRRRLLARALKAVSGAPFGPRYDRLLRLEGVISSGQVGKGVTLHGCEIIDPGGVLSIIREIGRADGPELAGGTDGLWDGRFHIEWDDTQMSDLPLDQLSIRCVGEKGLKLLKEHGAFESHGLPKRRILATLPAAWAGDQLLSVPLAGFGRDLFKARFILLD